MEGDYGRKEEGKEGKQGKQGLAGAGPGRL
jgi:hypothetical protein